GQQVSTAKTNQEMELTAAILLRKRQKKGDAVTPPQSGIIPLLVIDFCPERAASEPALSGLSL
ncbi:MAG: hypothetical protein IK079_00190, partial [Desulfovibrio sp.]|nr:hypothetical protein [Desulfovibrio sp.]